VIIEVTTGSLLHVRPDVVPGRLIFYFPRGERVFNLANQGEVLPVAGLRDLVGERGYVLGVGDDTAQMLNFVARGAWGDTVIRGWTASGGFVVSVVTPERFSTTVLLSWVPRLSVMGQDRFGRDEVV
jgi:hypothetical protein